MFMSGELIVLKIDHFNEIGITRYDMCMLTLKAVEGFKNHLKPCLNIMC